MSRWPRIALAISAVTPLTVRRQRTPFDWTVNGSVGANVTAADAYGDQPLHWASARGHPEAVAYLLDWEDERRPQSII